MSVTGTAHSIPLKTPAPDSERVRLPAWLLADKVLSEVPLTHPVKDIEKGTFCTVEEYVDLGRRTRQVLLDALDKWRAQAHSAGMATTQPLTKLPGKLKGASVAEMRKRRDLKIGKPLHPLTIANAKRAKPAQ